MLTDSNSSCNNNNNNNNVTWIQLIESRSQMKMKLFSPPEILRSNPEDELDPWLKLRSMINFHIFTFY